MIDIDADCTRTGTVTRVRATVRNARQTPQRVVLESTLDGPVWAPRTGPLVVPEWGASTWQGVVPPGGTRGVGFATSAPPCEEPLSILATERADREAEPAVLLEDLDRSAPPSAIVRDP